MKHLDLTLGMDLSIHSKSADQFHLAKFDLIGFAILVGHTEKDDQMTSTIRHDNGG